MHLKGRIRRLLSSSTTTTGNNPPQVQVSERSRRTSDVSENSDISYDRSSGSFVQRVSTSLRRRSGKFRRASSEGAPPAFHFAEEKSFDGGSLSFSLAHDDSSRASPLRSQPQLPATPDSRKLVGGSPLAQSSDLPLPQQQQQQQRPISAVNEEEEEEADDDDYAPVPSAWGDEPTPEQLQQIQDRVSAWLHTSRPSPSPTTPSGGLQRFPSSMENNNTPSSALLGVPEEDDAEELEVPDPLAVRVQPLRTLDSISEDEPPTFAGSSVSTAPSTPFPLSSLPQLSRSRSQSPPLRRRSLEGAEEYYPRGLDTIQEAGGPLSTSLPSPRRSLDSAKQRPSSLVLESIPEIDLLPPSALTPTSASGSSSKRRLGIKGFGFARSESEPLMPTFRTNAFNPSFSTSSSNGAGYLSAKPRKAAPASLNLLTSSTKGAKSPSSSAAAAGRIGVREPSTSSPTLPSFQRGTNILMGQPRSSPTLPLSFTPKRGGGQERKPLNPRTYSLGAIAAESEVIEDDESRRLTEVAFLG